MNRKAFDRLEIQDQIKYINELLSQGNSFNHACKKVIRIPTSTVRDRFKAIGYAYNKEQNAYTEIKEHANNTKVTHESNVENTAMHSSNTPITPTEKQIVVHKKIDNNISIIEKEKGIKAQQEHANVTDVVLNKEVQDMLQLKDRLMDMLDWYETKRNIVDAPMLQIDNSKLTGEVMTRSFKIHKDILDRFIKYCKDHKEYTQRDLLSWALIEFLNKYE